ncbi:YopX family protein [Streptococcus sp. S784/96/1]|uniref:YopX family protein n=1 Tax=Streptococcus sp. S784/96/1 TaxID=2653499 RepID=UPI001386DBDE|nr:YopX family protein [Streptococcus sp. S784/96/1]
MIPKFRAWLKAEKQMIDVEFLDLSHKVLIGKHWEFGMTEAIKFDDVDIMQYTGLFDSQPEPEEIYKDYIVKRTSLMLGGRDFVGVVKMLEGCWVIDNGEEAINLWTEVDENIVIGNIFENPELLEHPDFRKEHK